MYMCVYDCSTARQLLALIWSMHPHNILGNSHQSVQSPLECILSMCVRVCVLCICASLTYLRLPYKFRRYSLLVHDKARSRNHFGRFQGKDGRCLTIITLFATYPQWTGREMFNIANTEYSKYHYICA